MASLSDLYTHLKTLCEQWFYTKTQMDTSLSGKASSTHTHNNITNDGKIGTTANKPLITTTGGVITTGSFGTSANTFCQGNDSRLSDARTPLSHNQASSTITDSNTYSNIGNTAQTQESINSAINTKLGELVDINFVTVVQTLPTASSSTMGKIYLVPITGSGTNNYAEYVTVQSGSAYSWEKFGEVSGSGLSVDWSDITSKPSTYPPSSHTHNNITNDGKVTVTGTNGGNLVVTNSSNQVIVQSSIDVLDGVVQQLITYGGSQMSTIANLYADFKTLCQQWFYTKTEMDTALNGKVNSVTFDFDDTTEELIVEVL